MTYDAGLLEGYLVVGGKLDLHYPQHSRKYFALSKTFCLAQHPGSGTLIRICHVVGG